MLQTLVLALLPSGGQLQARRNAWAAMSEGTQRARARGEADQAMERALQQALARQGQPLTSDTGRQRGADAGVAASP